MIGKHQTDSSLDERKVLSKPNRIGFEGMRCIKLGFFFCYKIMFSHNLKFILRNSLSR